MGKQKNNIDLPMSLIIRLVALLMITLGVSFLAPSQLHAQAVLRKDSSSVIAIRQMDTKFVDSILNEKAFQYDTQNMRGISAWDRFWMWVGYKINRLFDKDGFQLGFKILIWILAIAMISFAVVRIVGMEKISFWIRGQKSLLTAGEISEDNIYGIDFDKAIAEAESKSAYREAVRWLYLKSLRSLADRSFIDWKINKTNIDYAAELSSTPYSGDFQQLTRYYEYAWYGEFGLDNEDYKKISGSFIRFNKTVAI